MRYLTRDDGLSYGGGGEAGACSLKIFQSLGSPKSHVVRFEGSLK